ncbi:layilin [Elgaria multicarinata webbii]|uniref:layilin n=1 Tax=Elgaria multicarinata webbii TaxID=159646 RepID=UPI002FCD2110
MIQESPIHLLQTRLLFLPAAAALRLWNPGVKDPEELAAQCALQKGARWLAVRRCCGPGRTWEPGGLGPPHQLGQMREVRFGEQAVWEASVPGQARRAALAPPLLLLPLHRRRAMRLGAGGGRAARALLLLLLAAAAAATVCGAASAQGTRLPGGQVICRGGTQRPCYKFVYFHNVLRRVGFNEALQSCRRDGGDLVSIESHSEQKLIEKIIGSLSASDGDFWIGLTREDDLGNSTDCPSLYSWTDGSSSTFHNWYADEPSCGGEICVVMYHQPSAPDGDGGPYMFQWNDDRCNMRNNFICKYSQEKPTVASEMNTSQPEIVRESSTLTSPEEPTQEDMINTTLKDAKESVWSLEYILVPIIPVLLLLLVITAIFIFWLYAKRRREQTEVNMKERDTWLSPKRQTSPSLEIHNVIRKQSEADLAGTRPEMKNSSFRARHGEDNPDDLSGDYDNMAVNNSESGFVTLASTESGFVTNDIYELCNDRVGRSKESAWVENEIYGY